MDMTAIDAFSTNPISTFMNFVHPEFNFPGVQSINQLNSIPNEWVTDEISSPLITSFMPSAMKENETSDTLSHLSFQDAFWSNDSLKRLKQYVRQSNEFYKKVGEIMAERANIENRYAKEVSSLSHKLAKCSSSFMGNISNAYHTLGVEFDLEAENHRLFANSLNDEVVKPIKSFLDNHFKRRKDIDVEISKTAKHYINQRSEDLKCRLKMSYLINSIEQSSEKVKTTEAMHDIKSKNTIGDFHKASNTMKKLEIQLDNIEKKYSQSTVNVEYARQDIDIQMTKAIFNFEQMEKERFDEMIKVYQNITACMEILGKRLLQGTDKLKSATFSIEHDIKEITSRFGDSSVQHPEVLLYTIPAEDMKIHIDKERREHMLKRWIYKVEESIKHQDKSLQGISNLTTFCEDNSKFSLPEDDVHLKRTSLKLLRTLHEASLYKFKLALDSLNGVNIDNYDIKWLLVHTFENNNSISFVRLPHSLSFKLNRDTSSIASSVPNGFLSDDSKIANNHYPMIQNGDNLFTVLQGQQLCVAQFNYYAHRPDELSIKPGDVVRIMEKRPDYWWRGQLGDRIGLFPSTYVKELV